jgi:hypothetical protein
MKIPALIVVGSLGLALSDRASAAEGPPPDHGVEVAVRLGLSVAAGSIQDGTSLDSYAGSAVPLVLEAGWRFDPSLFVGGRFMYAFPQLKNPNGSCNNNGTSCDGYDMHLGVEGVYRFLVEQKFAPWAGLGFGYERASYDISARPNFGGGATYTGFQALVQGGGDVRLNSQLVLGPFAELAFGRFESADTRTRIGNVTTDTSADIQNTAWHTWISFGIRGAFGF